MADTPMFPALFKPLPKGIGHTCTLPLSAKHSDPVVSYDFVQRRQMQVELQRYEDALRKAATTDEELTEEEQELIWGTAI